MVETVVVTPPLVRVKLLVPRVSPGGMSGEVHAVPVKLAEVMEKLPAEPEVWETIASLEPEASLTTEAVTRRLLSPLIVLARSLRLSAVWPDPVGMVTDAPAVVVRVKDEEGRVAVELAAASEYHAPVLAKLLTTIVWVPAAVPVVAVADLHFRVAEQERLGLRVHRYGKPKGAELGIVVHQPRTADPK